MDISIQIPSKSYDIELLFVDIYKILHIIIIQIITTPHKINKEVPIIFNIVYVDVEVALNEEVLNTK